MVSLVDDNLRYAGWGDLLYCCSILVLIICAVQQNSILFVFGVLKTWAAPIHGTVLLSVRLKKQGAHQLARS